MATALQTIEMERRPGGSPHPASRPGKLVIRAPRDRSQFLRLSFQSAFLLINVAIGIQFYLFVRYFETGGEAMRVPRPAGVDGWLPIAGLMSLKYFLTTWSFLRIHPSALVLLSAFLLISLLYRKAFCSWLCPVGTLCEGLWKFGRKCLGMNWTLPRWADLTLRSVKYLLLGLFLYAIAGMPAESIRQFLEGPYGMVADVKMLDFFRHMGWTAGLTIGVLAVLSILVRNFWCRYLCPYGALMGLAALVSPVSIRRDPERCIDCSRCRKACPARLPVDRLITVKSAECTACLECVAACPAKAALQASVPGKAGVPAWSFAIGIAVIFLGLVFTARAAGVWQTEIADAVYMHLVPRAHLFVHP
jgi:polyferredoxin